jgi:uncharacterized low-complexity protein
MKKINKTAFVVGTSVIAGLSSTGVSADSNPFGVLELSSGYMNLAEADAVMEGADAVQEGAKKMKDGACGEGKCGGKKADAAVDKAKEGKCAGKMEDKAKAKEGKCGEGKCGNKK